MTSCLINYSVLFIITQQQLVSILVLMTGQMTNVCCEACCVVCSVDPTVNQHLLYGEFLFV